MTDVEIAIGLMDVSRKMKHPKWRQPRSPRPRKCPERQYRKTDRWYAARDGVDLLPAMRARIAENRWAEQLAGRRFEDQPDAK